MDESSQLILQARKGDEQAFTRLVEMHQQYAFHVAHQYLMDLDSAQDVAQEAFIRVWKHLHRFRLEQKFTTWLYRIVVNLCYDRLRSQRTTLIELDNEVVSDLDMEKEIQDQDKVRIIRQLVKKLSPKQRMVFILRDLDDLDIEEIAKMMGIGKGTIKSNLYYARKTIRERLTAMGIYNEK